MSHGTDLIGYAYDAALHCVECTLDRFTAVVERAEHENADADEHGLPYELLDSRGNPVAPIFETTELEADDACDDCGARFYEVQT